MAFSRRNGPNTGNLIDIKLNKIGILECVPEREDFELEQHCGAYAKREPASEILSKFEGPERPIYMVADRVDCESFSESPGSAEATYSSLK